MVMVEYEVIVEGATVAVVASSTAAQRQVDHLCKQGEVAHYRPMGMCPTVNPLVNGGRHDA